jgi:Acyl-CoA reductase (LuxC)
MLQLRETLSTKPKVVNQTLLEHIEGTRLTDDWYRVFGGRHGEGAIIVSQIDEPVHYSTLLSGRVANIVPVDSIDKVTEAVNAYTQTIGIYPESLKDQLRDQLSLFGAQRLTSLGYAASVNFTIPQDAMEPVRRMCKWIVDEHCEPERIYPLWKTLDFALPG